MGSSKLQISNIVNFGWEFQYSYGQLVAVHKSGIYFAYAIVSPGKNTGMVRVVQKKTDQRVLVKGMKGKIKDLAFAHCLDQVSQYLRNIFAKGSSENYVDRRR